MASERDKRAWKAAQGNSLSLSWLCDRKDLGWLILAVGIVLGIFVGPQFKRFGVGLPSVFLNATATHGGETMALATGAMGDGVEGIFILDFVSGELTCLVANPRTGAFRLPYIANVATDLQIKQGKQPRYLLVTGAARFRIEGEPEPADSIVYVADANTGSYVAYWMPRQRYTAFYGFPEPIPMRVLHKEIGQ